MNDCMANVSLFIIRTAYGSEAEKINLLAGLLQKAGLQGEIKVACGVEALGRLFGLKRYQSVVYGFSIIAGQKWLKSWSSFEKGKAGFSYFPSEDLHLWYLKPIK